VAGDFDGDFGDFAAEAGRGEAAEAAFFSRAMDREAARRAAAAAARGDLGAAGMDPAARARIAFRRATSSMTASVSDESNNVASRPGGEPRTPRRSEGGVRASASGLVSLVSAARRRGAADGDETRSPVSSNFALWREGEGRDDGARAVSYSPSRMFVCRQRPRGVGGVDRRDRARARGAHLRLGATLSKAARSAGSRLWKKDFREGWNPPGEEGFFFAALPSTSPWRRFALDPNAGIFREPRGASGGRARCRESDDARAAVEETASPRRSFALDRRVARDSGRPRGGTPVRAFIVRELARPQRVRC
jgi:hypothetical protein